MTITFHANDPGLQIDEFLALFHKVLWTAEFDRELVRAALSRTINITARDSGSLVGCTRVLSDGYLLSTICELLVHPEYHATQITRRLLELANLHSPTSLVLATQSMPEDLMELLGWIKGKVGYTCIKSAPPWK